MENDPNKKESRVKRLIKKAKKRSSKSSNNSQNSALEVSRSESLDNKHVSIKINESTPLPKAEGGTKEETDNSSTGNKIILDKKKQNDAGLAKKDVIKSKKNVDIQENRNEVFEAIASTSADKNTTSIPANADTKDETFLKPESTKRSLKRKLEEESGAGTSGTSTGTSDNDADDKDPSKDKKKKNRCAVCRKKVGLTGFECRCGGLFCAVHRYSDKHECSFDYRELGAQEIRRNNPVVVSQKIHKI